MSGTGEDLVSVIMPCFNAGRMLEPALRSVLAQSYGNLELIFVDNLSTDGSLERAQSIAAASERICVFASCPVQGANPARDHGYALASGRYIQWADADDELEPRKIALQVAALQQSGDDIAHGGWRAREHPQGKPPIETTQPARPFDDPILRLLSGTWFPPISYLLRREAADRLQRESAWWPDCLIAEDFEYFAVAAMLGMRFRFVPQAQVTYNAWSSTQLSNRGSLIRAHNVRNVLARLRLLADRPEIAARLGPPHRALLEQNCDLWTIRPGSVQLTKLDAQRWLLTHARTGRTLETSSQVAGIVHALQRFPRVDIMHAHTKLAASCYRALVNEHAAVAVAIEHLRQHGYLELVARLDDVAATGDAHSSGL